jgi:hypothetical protein
MHPFVVVVLLRTNPVIIGHRCCALVRLLLLLCLAGRQVAQRPRSAVASGRAAVATAIEGQTAHKLEELAELVGGVLGALPFSAVVLTVEICLCVRRVVWSPPHEMMMGWQQRPGRAAVDQGQQERPRVHPQGTQTAGART